MNYHSYQLLVVYLLYLYAIPFSVAWDKSDTSDPSWKHIIKNYEQKNYSDYNCWKQQAIQDWTEYNPEKTEIERLRNIKKGYILKCIAKQINEPENEEVHKKEENSENCYGHKEWDFQDWWKTDAFDFKFHLGSPVS